jgi:hypothetical protein
MKAFAELSKTTGTISENRNNLLNLKVNTWEGAISERTEDR